MCTIPFLDIKYGERLHHASLEQQRVDAKSGLERLCRGQAPLHRKSAYF
eukprot:CAMPEP_0197923160 /NCGR_PEP_ID=MMETSP1439-20131203/93499_1 /TAXON_ID=66791 /ORGANISM="Gonyaulax spinifera, Strain CCMP409" /LENGTH=48 /DNA_ID= /DNA_START= /DNA_END= /DNA_ORIENTATION=